MITTVLDKKFIFDYRVTIMGVNNAVHKRMTIEREDVAALAKTALETRRQDREALDLYWQYVQEHADGEILPKAYQLLYTAWAEQENRESLASLIDAACQQHFSDIHTIEFMADSEFQAKRDRNALKLYDRLITLNALNTNTYRNIKATCFRYQPFDNFVNLLLHQCLTYHPDDTAILRFLFSQYLLHEDYMYTPFAPQIYDHMLALEPANLTARSILCECYCRQEKYQNAIALGEEGFQYHRHHPDLLAVLARAYYNRGEYGRVVAYCQNILAKRPGRSEIQVMLADVYSQNALTTNEAIHAYRLALKCAPNHLSIRQALLRSYLRRLMINEAVAECEQIVAELYEEYEPDSTDFQRAIKLMIEEYERAIRRSPGDITLYLITAKLHEYIGHFHKALIYYRTMLELPLNEELLEKLIEFLEKLATSQVQNPHLYLYLGLLYHNVQRYDEAKLAFREVMYSDLDDREVEDILIRHDRSIWRYPPVLVILAHHRIVIKDILEGLVQTFRSSDHEDWNGAIWVLQELYDVDDVILELRQIFEWESFNELYPHLIPIFEQNGSRLSIQILNELLTHPHEQVRLQALDALMQIDQPFAAQCISEASTDNGYADVRYHIAQYYAQYVTEQTTYHLTNMLHDEEKPVRLCIAQALRHRDVQPEPFREALFTEQDPEVRLEIILLLIGLQSPDEAPYLARLFNDLVTKRHSESDRTTGTVKVYHRLKKLIGYSGNPEEIKMLSVLIQALGMLQAEQAIYGLITIANNDNSQLLRIEAIQALGQIGSSLGISPLETLLHASSESQEIRIAAEQALDQIIQGTS